MSIYTVDTPFPASQFAKDRAIGASQFREQTVASYKSNYENFWCLGLPEITVVEMQATIDAMGVTALLILADSAKYVGGLVAAFPDDIDEKYRSSPYTYTVSETGQITLGELKEAWQPEEENGDQA